MAGRPRKFDFKPDNEVYAHWPKEQLLPRGQGEMCEWNTRKIREKSPKMLEMIASVAEVGIEAALLGRPHPDPVKRAAGIIQWVWGKRRLFGSDTNGRMVVPTIVKEMTDLQARAATARENLDREDLSPQEEAESIRVFVGMNLTVEQIAEELKRKPEWVAKRLALAELAQEWFDLWLQDADEEDATVISRFSMGHMETIARMPKEVQDMALAKLKTVTWVPSVQQLEQNILSEFTMLLKAAPFDLDDETLNPAMGSCNGCPFRSSCKKLLFADLKDVEDGDRCLNKACWTKKVAAHVANREAKLREQHPNLVKLTSEHHGGNTPSGMLHAHSVMPKAQKDGGIPALHVDGPKAGKVEFVQPLSSGNRTQSADKPSGPLTLDERKEKMNRRRVFLRVEKMVDVVCGSVDGKKALPTPKASVLLPLVAGLGLRNGHEWMDRHHWKAVEKFEGNPQAMHDALWAALVDVIRARFRTHSNTDTKLADEESGELAARLLGQKKWDALWDEVLTELPDPKSWETAEKQEAKAKADAKNEAKAAKINASIAADNAAKVKATAQQPALLAPSEDDEGAELEAAVVDGSAPAAPVVPVKRGRGRPPKNPK